MGKIQHYKKAGTAMHLRGVVFGLFAIVALIAGLFTTVMPARAATGINEQVNYQGRLLDSTGAIVADGTYNMEFKIYQDGDGCVVSGTTPCSGTLKWTETRTSTNKVTLRNGYFSVQLGEVTAFGTSVDWNQSVLWLSVNVGGTGTPTWDGEMLPFRRLAATPYALNAKQLGGLDWTKFVQVAPSAVQVDSGTLDAIAINKTGASGNILQLQKNGTEVLAVTNAGLVRVDNGLAVGGTTTITTPQGSSVNTAISIAPFDPGGFGQVLAFGVPSSANTTSRVLSLFDARTTPHQPSFALFSPNENSLVGFNWNGSNTQANVQTVDQTAGSNSSGLNIQTGGVSGGGGSSGALYLQSGSVAGGTGYTSGDIVVQSGNGNGTNSSSGNIAIDPGTKTGTGTVGTINVGTANATTINIGNIANAATTLQGATLSLKSAANIALGTSDTTGTLLVLDTKTGAGDPTGVNGGMYYNSNANAFRCYQNTAWTNCIGAGGSTDLQGAYTSSTSPATITTTDGKNIVFNMADTTTDPNFLVNLQCVTSCAGNGRFAVQLAGSDILTVDPTTGGTTIQNTNTATAFRVLNAVNGNFFTIDSASSKVIIGNPANCTTGRFCIQQSSSGTGSGTVTNMTNSQTVTQAGGTPTIVNQNITITDTSTSTASTLKALVIDTSGTTNASATINTIYGKIPSGATGTFMQLQNGSTDVLNLSNSGALALKTTTDTATAFKVLNAAGTATVLDVDTANQRVGIGTAAPSRTAHVAVSNTTTTSMPVLVEQAGTGDAGIELKTPGRSFYMGLDQSDASRFKISSSTAASSGSFTVGWPQGITDDSGNASQTIVSKTNAAGNSGTLTSMSIYIGAVDATNQLVQLGLYSDDGTGTKPTTLIATTGSQTLVANSWNTVPISASITAGTVYWVGYEVNGAATHEPYNGSTSSSKYFSTTFGTWSSDLTAATPVTTAALAYSVYMTATIGGSFDNLNTSLLAMSDTGQTTFQNSTNSTSAFQINNAASTSLLKLDSSGGNQNNLIANPDFEVSTANWAAKGTTPTTFVRDSTQSYQGTASLKVTTQATANQGAQYAVTLTDATLYSASFYAKIDNTSIGMATLAAGYSSDGTTDNTACTQNTAALTNSGWTRVTCNFKTPASHSGTPYFYIKQTDAVIHTLYIDGVLLQTDTNTDNNFRDSKLSLQGILTSPLVLQNSSNSTNAFNIQNAAGNNVFTVDTTDTNMVTNPGFEVNTTGWAAVGGTTTINRDTSQSWMGNASLNVTTSATASAGAKFTTGNVQPTQLAVSSTYTLSWYSKLSASTFTDMIAGYDVDGAGAGAVANCTGINTQTNVTTGWTRFTCTITTTATVPASDAYIIIMQTAGTARTFYLDGIQLESGATATAYAAGSVFINGIITTPATFRNLNNSTSAFAIQNAASTNLFSVDSLNGSVFVNTSATSGVVTMGGTAQTGTITVGQATTSQTIGIGTGQTAAGNTLTVNIGTSATSTGKAAITIGNTNGASSLTLQAGTGNIALTGAAGTTYTVGATTTTGAITIGQSTATNTISIGSALTAAGNTQTISIGAGALNSTGLTAITIGNSNASTGASTVTIKAGTTAATKGPSVTLGATASTAAVCSSLANAAAPVGGTAYELRDCNAAPAADFAEMYPAAHGLEVGDVVTQGPQQVNTYNWDPATSEVNWSSVKGTVSQMVKATTPYSPANIGIVSDNYLDFASTGNNVKKEDNPTSIALVGRVNVKVTTENGQIAAGDFLTASATKPGYAMKATRPGYALGQALAPFISDTPGVVMIFVHPSYFPGDISATGGDLQNGGNFDQMSIANLHVAGTLTVTGNAVFHGLLSANDIAINGHINVGKDTAGTVVIPAGQTSIAITFQKKYQSPPVVTTSSSDFVPLKVTQKTANGFTLTIPQPQPQDLKVDWFAVETAQ